MRPLFFLARPSGRGKLHLVLLGSSFPGETPAGAAQLVWKVRAAMNIRFQSGDQPGVALQIVARVSSSSRAVALLLSQ